MTNKQPNILIVGAENFGRGGRSVISWNLTLPLSNSYQIDFLSRHAVKDTTYFEKVSARGGDIIEINIDNKLKKYQYLRQLVRQKNYDIVHINADQALEALKMLLLFRTMGIKNFIIHAHTARSNVSLLKRIAFKLSQTLINIFQVSKITCSLEAANYMFGTTENVEVIENGIFLENYIFSEVERMEYRKKLSLSDREVIGTVGRFSYPKNPYFIIDFIEEYSKRNVYFKFLWIGDGELHDDIHNEINRRKLTDYIIFLGNRNDVNHLLMVMDVFILPSFYEGFGIVNIEAQVGGLTSVVSEAVPKTAKINPNFYRLSLDKGADYWADFIYKLPKERFGTVNLKTFRHLGFDIHQGSLKLAKQYKKILG